MPSEAFISAASASNRQPVVLLAIESIDAIKIMVTTEVNWQAAALTNINTAVVPGEVRLITDDNETVSGPQAEEVSLNNLMIPDAAGGQWGSTGIFYNRNNLTAISVDCNVDSGCRPAGTRLYGRLNGGAWQVVASTGPTTTGAPITLANNSLTRGFWEFYASATYSIATPNKTIYLQTCKTTHITHYVPTGTLTTAATGLDLGLIPNQASRFESDDIIPTGCTITYNAWGKDTIGAAWSSLGAVSDGATLAAHRYYQISATLTSSSDGMDTPIITELRIIGGDSQYKYLSTHKDTPVQGALPYIVPGGISSISSKIDLTQQATVGELTAKLFWRQQVGDMIAGDFLKNKTIICKLGFVGLSEADYEPYFVGTWHDYQSDQTTGTITVKTRNVLKRFTKKIPEATYFLDADFKQFVPPKTKTYSGNVMQVMLDIADELTIPDRYINRASFTDLAAGARAGAVDGTDWYVTRTIHEPTDAKEMLNELSVSSGVFLFEGADGKLTARLYEDIATATAAATLDAKHFKFRSVDGGQKDLSTRQAIYYQLQPGKDGGNTSDFGHCLLRTNDAAEIAWSESSTREWKDKWGLSVKAIQLIAERWHTWFSVPRATVRVDDVPPRLYGLERGQVVAVDNLQLPCASGDWQGFTSGTRFLIMGKNTSDPTTNNLTVSFELLQLETPNFVTDPAFPDYARLEYWPTVTALTATPRVITTGGVVSGVVDVVFAQPTDYTTGSAIVWTRTNGGEWLSHAVLPFGLQETIKRLSIPANPGDTVEIKVTTARPDHIQMPLVNAPNATATITIPAATAPTALTAAARLFAIELDVTFVAVAISGYCEIWAATTNNRNTAVQVGITKTSSWIHQGLNTGDTRYYWVRAFNGIDAVASAWYPYDATSGVTATALNDPTKVLKLLNSSVADADITAYLAGSKPLLTILDTKSMLFELGVVGAGVTATYTDALSQAASQMNANQSLLQYLNNTVAGLTVSAYSGSTAYTTGQIVTYLGQTYQCILASTGNLPTNTTYWAPISGLYQMYTDFHADYVSQTGTFTDHFTSLDGLVSDLNDPVNGRVTLAETDIIKNGDGIAIVGTAIVGPLALVIGAVVEPGVIVEDASDITGLDLTVSKTIFKVDTANNNILLQAGQIDGLTGRVSSAEIAIDGANAAINLRATQGELSGQVDILSNMIGLKLNATGTASPGMAIGWTDGTHTKSLIEFRTDTLAISKPDGTGSRPVFTVGSIGGTDTVGINGNVVLDGTLSASKIVTGSLVVGDNVTMGASATINWDKVNSRPTDLSGLDSTAATKLATIATGATVGGTWGTNINGVPSNILTLNGTEAIQNSSITIDVSGNLQGIGTGANTTVKNQMITISADGKLIGVGTANVVVDNSKITLESLSAMPLTPATPTNIGSNWIYTGTLTAAQVNAVAIHAGSITTGTLTIRSSKGLYTADDTYCRIVRGQVSPTGIILNGSGFTVTHTSTGNYAIEFSTWFANVPITVATAMLAGGVDRCVSIFGFSEAIVQIFIRDTSGNLVDSTFNFIAIGNDTPP